MQAEEKNTKALYRYRFGSAEFDEARFELSVAGSVVEVQRKPLEVLAALLAHAGEVVTKDELIANVWEGRPTVENVIANALTKLRDALGHDNAAHIVTQPRVGYRLKAPVQRVAVGQAMYSRIQLAKGAPVPQRPHFELHSLLSASNGSEVWVARHLKTNERRVYKFSPDAERLNALKREVTIFRLLQGALGDREDLVRILDWNFETPPFFLESEFGGENLHDWAAAKGSMLGSMTLPQRIDLFVQIARVVAAAHDVGVLHKDIKPTNVLISSQDGSACRIRLSDFGSARLLDPERIRELGITQLGLTMTTAVGSGEQSGTLLYLAPELMRLQAPTIQSDVYALGMMLYQLLVGDLRRPLVCGWEREIDDELLCADIRAATEGNPAHRLSSVHTLIERLTTLDARRSRLRAQAEAQALADQARETLRRAKARRPWVIAACVSGALFLVGFASSSWLYLSTLRAQDQLVRARAMTEQEAARARAVTEFLNNDVLGAADPFSSDAAKRRTVEQALSYAAANLDGKFAGDPKTEAAIRMTLGNVLENLGDNVAAEKQWRRAIAVLGDGRPYALPTLVQSRYGLARALVKKSQFDQAARELKAADHLRLTNRITDPQTQVVSQYGWGHFYYAQQKAAQAIPFFERTLRLHRAQSPGNLYRADGVRISLGNAYIYENRLKEAELLLHDLIEEMKRRNNPTPSELQLATATGMYGQTLLYQHRYESAAPLIEQAYQATRAVLPASHPLALDALNLRCTLYSMTKQLARSLECVQESHALTVASRGEQHWFALSLLVGVGQAQYGLGDHERAVRSLESARPGLVRAVGADNPMAQLADYYMARSLLHLHESDRAAMSLQRLNLEALEASEPGAPWALRLQLLRGMLLLEQGQRREAQLLLRPAAEATADRDSTDTLFQEARESLRRSGLLRPDQQLADATNDTRP